jgi:hypothetical protein
VASAKSLPSTFETKLAGHARAQVRAADSDVDEVSDPAPGVPGPAAAAHPLREARHAVENLVDPGHHVLTVHKDRCVAGCAEGDVEDGAVLAPVDPLAGEHGVDAPAQAGLRRQPQEQPQGLLREEILRVVEVEAAGLQGETLSATGVVGEEPAQVERRDLRPVRGERLPGCPLGGGRAHLGCVPPASGCFRRRPTRGARV